MARPMPTWNTRARPANSTRLIRSCTEAVATADNGRISSGKWTFRTMFALCCTDVVALVRVWAKAFQGTRPESKKMGYGLIGIRTITENTTV